MNGQLHVNLSKRCFYKIISFQATQNLVEVLGSKRNCQSSLHIMWPIAGQYATTGRARCRRCGEDIQKLNPVGGFTVSNLWRGHAQTHTHNSVVSRRERITVGPKTVTNHRRHRELQSSSCHIFKPMYLWIPIVLSRTEIKPSMTQTNPITCMLVAQLDILFCLLESIV